MGELTYGQILLFYYLTLVVYWGVQALRFYALRRLQRGPAYLISEAFIFIFLLQSTACWAVLVRQALHANRISKQPNKSAEQIVLELEIFLLSPEQQKVRAGEKSTRFWTKSVITCANFVGSM
jgi:hypothetical protein